MRPSFSRCTTTILVALLVVGCASATSPVPVMTASPSVASSAPSQSPAASPRASGSSITAIAAGYHHTCALTSGGGVMCWGATGSSQAEPGTIERGTVPVDVTGLATGVTAISAGGDHTCALMSGGGVKCWGDNGAGQLGNGTTTDSNAAPVDVSGMSSSVITIAAGGAHTCAVMSGGGVKCWGSNTYGQLGTGTTIDSSVPVEVSGLAGEVTALAAGLLNTCALTSGGGVTCWGYAATAGLEGPAAHSLVPIDVTGLGSGVRAVAAGYELTCALTTGGGVKCWGRNYAGQLGDGTTTDSRTVVDVAGLGSGISAVSVGVGGHACALAAGGAVKCWGSDGYGQRGDGSNSQSLVPVEVSGLGSGVRAITTGADHTCALTDDGAVLCWGDNWDGQSGSGTPCDSSDVPVRVDFATPSSISSPTDAPRGALSHATGPTDVVLRFGDGAVVGVGELDGERFEPGRPFTLYGDGTVIFSWAGAPELPDEGPILRGAPFGITHLDEDEVQALLWFALEEGGLGDACERYETRDTDVAEYFVYTLRAGGVERRVEGSGPNRFPELATHLLNIDRVARHATRVWVPDRYWGNLLTAGPWIELGVLPDPGDADLVPWPWPGITPEAFAGIEDGGWASAGRRVMSADEAAVMGLSDYGGVVARVYLLGPDGATIYSFSLWPMLPDETT